MIIDEKTVVPLKVAVLLISCAITGAYGYASGKTNSDTAVATVTAQMIEHSRTLQQHTAALHDADKRLALVERAVVALELLARDKGK